MTTSRTLVTLRDHCRDMAEREHRPECGEALREWERLTRWRGLMAAPDPGPRPPDCEGCITADDRALFKQIADEIDAYLGSPVQDGLDL